MGTQLDSELGENTVSALWFQFNFVSRKLLGPIDFSSNEIVKRIELCLSSFKGQSMPFPQSSASRCSLPVLRPGSVPF